MVIHPGGRIRRPRLGSWCKSRSFVLLDVDFGDVAARRQPVAGAVAQHPTGDVPAALGAGHQPSDLRSIGKIGAVNVSPCSGVVIQNAWVGSSGPKLLRYAYSS